MEPGVLARRACHTLEAELSAQLDEPYRKEPEPPSRRFTTRSDLAKSILDELETGDDIHKAVAVTSR